MLALSHVPELRIKRFQKKEFRARESDRRAGAGDNMLGGIEDDVANLELNSRFDFLASCERSKSCEKHLEGEGFCQVIVRPGVQSL